jgi:malonate transporter
MTIVLSIVLPIFGLIALGVVGGKTRLFPEAAAKALSNFVLYVAVPALMFRTIQRVGSFDAFNPDVGFAYYGASFLVVAGALAFGRGAFGLSGGERASFAMGSMFSNTGLVGIPLVFATWGDEGMVPLMVIISFHSLVFVTFFFVLHDMAKSGAVGWANAGRAAVHAIVTNPVVVSIVVGFAWLAGGLELPGFVATIIAMLGDAAIPAALFALGVALAQFPVAGNLMQASVMSAVKLVIHPIVVFAVANWVFALTPLEVAVVTLSAGLPGGLMIYIVAQSYGVYVARAASSLVIGTAGAVVTVSALLAWMA